MKILLVSLFILSIALYFYTSEAASENCAYTKDPRVERLIAISEIETTISGWAHAANMEHLATDVQGSKDAILALLAPDSEFLFQLADRKDVAMTVSAKDYADSAIAMQIKYRAPPLMQFNRHILTNPQYKNIDVEKGVAEVYIEFFVISINVDQAKLYSMGSISNGMFFPANVTHLGTYDDVYRRQPNGKWLLGRRISWFQSREK